MLRFVHLTAPTLQLHNDGRLLFAVIDSSQQVALRGPRLHSLLEELYFVAAKHSGLSTIAFDLSDSGNQRASYDYSTALLSSSNGLIR